MALTEERVLAEVTWLVEADTMQVRWDNNILRDGARIYRVPHRKAYSKNQKQEFADEVAGATKYLTAAGW